MSDKHTKEIMKLKVKLDKTSSPIERSLIMGMIIALKDVKK